MAIEHSEDTKAGESLLGLQRYLIKFVVVVAVLLIAVPLLPGLISNLAYSFSGHAPKLYWYLSRSAGFVALTILWASMVLGLGITNKMARLWPGAPAAFAIHEFVSLLGLAFAIYHGLVLMGDHFVDFSLPRLLVPFSIAYETLWVGFGQVAFYIWALVAASFYIRRRIGQKTWRLIHFINFATYTLGWLHGIFSGTDSVTSWVRWYYVVTGGSLLVLLAYRLHEAASRRNFYSSFAVWSKQRAQELTQAATQAAITVKRRTLTPMEEQILDSLLRSQNRPSESAMDKANGPEFEAATFLPVAGENLEQAVVDQKPQLRTSEIPMMEDSAAEITAIPGAKEAAPSPAPVENIEQGAGKSKIRIRIFKEPPEEQVILKPQKDTRLMQVDLDPLVAKLKKFFRATPIQPEKQVEKPRVRILDD